MPKQGRRVTLGQQLVARFAGFLAHLLNTGEKEVVALDLGKLYIDIHALLAGSQGQRSEGNPRSPYVQSLVGLPLYPPGTTPVQAASTYFEKVLKRPLFLVGKNHSHKGHQVFLALCRRGPGGVWATAELVRSKVSSSSPPSLFGPAGFGDVGARLGAVCHPHARKISDGNPAHSTRGEHGPLYLKVDGHVAEIPEEMSIWQAICCAPALLNLLPTQEFYGFSSVMLKAVEVANKPYGVRLALKLPLAETDEYTTHKLKRTLAFRSKTRAIARELNVDPNDMEVWNLAWSTNPVPGHDKVSEFRDSALGRHLWLNSPIAELATEDTWSEIGTTEIADEPPSDTDEDSTDELGETQFKGSIEPWIKELVLAGVLGPYDEWFLRKRAEGHELRRLARSKRTLMMFGKFVIPVSYEGGLLARIRQHLADKNY